MSKRRRLAVTTLLTLLVVGLFGCSETSSGPGGLLASRGNRYCLQAGALGAAGGAAAGALLGRALAGGHDNTTSMLVGGLIGAAAGGLASCRYGVWVANQRQTYENEQARLTGELNNSRRTNESLVELNRQLADNLSSRKQELASLRAARASSSIQAGQKQQLAAQLNEGYQGAKQQLAKAEEELQHHRQTLAALQAQPQQVDKEELATYRQQIAELKQSVGQLQGLTQQYANASGSAARL